LFLWAEISKLCTPTTAEIATLFYKVMSRKETAGKKPDEKNKFLNHNYNNMKNN